MDEQSTALYGVLLRYKGRLEGINAPASVKSSLEDLLSALLKERPLDPADLEIVRSYVEDMDTENPDYQSMLETLKDYRERISP